MALMWILTCNVKDLAKANMKLSLHNVSICKAFISSKAMPSMLVTWCVISIYMNTTRSDGTCGTRWWCNDNTCSQRNLSRIVVDSDKIPPLEVESLPRGVDRTRVEAMIQHTRTSQGTRLYKGGVIWHIIKTPPASLTTCNSLWQVWQQLPL